MPGLARLEVPQAIPEISGQLVDLPGIEQRHHRFQAHLDLRSLATLRAFRWLGIGGTAMPISTRAKVGAPSRSCFQWVWRNTSGLDLKMTRNRRGDSLVCACARPGGRTG